MLAVLLTCVQFHKYVMTPNIVQALSDMHHEDAPSPTIWTAPSADCGVNEVETAAGGYYRYRGACNDSTFGRQVVR